MVARPGGPIEQDILNRLQEAATWEPPGGAIRKRNALRCWEPTEEPGPEPVRPSHKRKYAVDVSLVGLGQLIHHPAVVCVQFGANVITGGMVVTLLRRDKDEADTYVVVGVEEFLEEVSLDGG